ncbi:hypothetical protein AB0C93_03275 [Streptomyces sp. NPDC048518]|uniref:hypothetical protein n=1 Tax=Streptomyces sp. NPDC048518 TaxID=3155029 RepID=UPI0033CB42D7
MLAATLVAAAVALHVTAPGARSEEQPDLTRYYERKIDWGSGCGVRSAERLRKAGRPPPPHAKRLECGELTVPRDYGRPDKAQVLRLQLFLDYSPDTRTEAAAYARHAALRNARCGRNGGPLLPWVGTVDVSRDRDVPRAALVTTPPAKSTPLMPRPRSWSPPPG